MYDLRRRFVTESVSTAGPSALLTMLMDRLVLDLDRADRALEATDRAAATEHLLHAQQIIDALRASLDSSVWDGAEGLAGIYDYTFSLLVTANVRADRDKLTEARGLMGPLRDAWAQAATSEEGTAALSGTTTTSSSPSSGLTTATSPTTTTGGLLGVG